MNNIPAPVTAAQRLELMRQRATYEQQLQLTPDNAISGSVNRDLEYQRESQINSIGERLHSAHDEMRSDWSHTMHQGHAAARFNNAVAHGVTPSPAPSKSQGHER